MNKLTNTPSRAQPTERGTKRIVEVKCSDCEDCCQIPVKIRALSSKAVQDRIPFTPVSGRNSVPSAPSAAQTEPVSDVEKDGPIRDNITPTAMSARSAVPPAPCAAKTVPVSDLYKDGPDPLYVIPMLIRSPNSPPRRRRTQAEKYATMAEELRLLEEGKLIWTHVLLKPRPRRSSDPD